MNGNGRNRYAHVVFCEDIRFEAGGKTSLIGVLNGSLIVDSLPALIPRLCLVISVNCPVDDPIEHFKVSCYLADEVVAEAEVTAEMLSKARASIGGAFPERNKLPEPTWHLMTTNLQLTPFPIEQEGMFRVVVATEREEINPPGLRIVANSPAE